MAAILNDDLQKMIDQQGNYPLEVIHPGTQKVYYLVAREQYERLKPLFLDDPLSVEEQRFQIQQAGKRAGWDAPEMDDYDDYDKHQPKP